MLRALGRMIVVPLAIVMATAAALFVLVSVGQERVVTGFSGRRPNDVGLGDAFDLLKLLRGLFSLQTILPGLLLVIVGEVARIRSAMYYVLGGGAALAAVPLFVRASQGGILETSPIVWQVFATAGFTAGFVYWLVAGRNA